MKIPKILVFISFAVFSLMAVYELIEVGGRNSGGGTVSLGPASLMRQSVSTGQYEIFLYAVREHLRTNADWAMDASNTVSELNSGNAESDLGGKLNTSYITQDRTTGRTNRTLWWAGKIRGKNSAKLNLNMLRYTQHSSDQADSLKSTYSLLGGNYVYTPQAIGIIHGDNGDEIINSEDKTTMVDEIIFSGMQSPYYPYSSQTELDAIDNYVTTNKLAITCTLEVVGSDGNVLASASRTIGVNPKNGDLTISIARVDNNQIELTLHGDHDGNVFIDYKDPGTNWAEVDFVPTEHPIQRILGKGSVRIFRARLP